MTDELSAIDKPRLCEEGHRRGPHTSPQNAAAAECRGSGRLTSMGVYQTIAI